MSQNLNKYKNILHFDCFPNLFFINRLAVIICFFFCLILQLSFWLLPDFFSKTNPKTNIDVLLSVTKSIQIVFLSFYIVLNLISLPIIFYTIRFFLYAFFIPSYLKKLVISNLKIINNIDLDKIKPKVAIVQSVCNDFVPSSFVDLFNQTYKNVDYFILDDSYSDTASQQLIECVDMFKKKYGKDVTIIKRNTENKKKFLWKFGNIKNFVENYCDKYDYILETDTSSVLSYNYLEIALKYFYSNDLKTKEIVFVVGSHYHYETHNLFSKFVDKSMQFMRVVAGETALLGSPLGPDGFATLYKASALKKIPFEKVQCPIDDYARGLWLINNKFCNVYCPLIYAAKIAPRNIYHFKEQRCKWYSGEMFLFRSKLSFCTKKDIYHGIGCLFNWYMTGIYTWLNFFVSLSFNVFLYLTSYHQIILPQLIVLSSVAFLPCLILISIYEIKKISIKPLLIFAFVFPFMHLAILYDAIYSIVYIGYILKKTWYSKYVLPKKVINLTPLQKIKLIMPRLLISIAIFVTVFLLDHFLIKTNVKILNIPIYVFLIVLPLITPLICYILFIFIGEIKVKNKLQNINDINGANINKKHFLYDWIIHTINKTKNKKIIESFNKCVGNKS